MKRVMSQLGAVSGVVLPACGIFLLYASLAMGLMSGLGLKSVPATMIADLVVGGFLAGGLFWANLRNGNTARDSLYLGWIPRGKIGLSRGTLTLLMAALGVLVFVVGQSGASWLLTHGFSGGTSEYSASLSENSPMIVTLLVLVAAPFFEEVFFRGFLLNRLCGLWWGRYDVGFSYRGAMVTAVILQAVLFALSHATVPHLASVFMMGLFQGLLVIVTGRLWVAMVYHGLYNLMTAMAPPWAVFPVFHQGWVLLIAYVLVLTLLGWMMKKILAVQPESVTRTRIGPPCGVAVRVSDISVGAGNSVRHVRVGDEFERPDDVVVPEQKVSDLAAGVDVPVEGPLTQEGAGVEAHVFESGDHGRDIV